MITLDYPQEEMDGPPFAVVDAEMRNLFTGVSPAVIIDRRDILAKEPKFAERGVSRLDTVVYRLGSRPERLPGGASTPPVGRSGRARPAAWRRVPPAGSEEPAAAGQVLLAALVLAGELVGARLHFL